jgi:hypothetical protein
LDLLAVAPHPQWLALALAFLNAYDNAPVLAQLKKELALPNRHGLDLVERPNKFCKSCEGKTAPGKNPWRDR